MGVQQLAAVIKQAVENSRDDGAVRGRISGSMVIIGSTSYPFTAVVDCNTNSGDYVWCQVTSSGMAVVVGA